MNVCVVGTGYVGLVTGTCFAEFGNDVICVDVDKKKIDNLNKGILPIYEPGLDVMVARNVKEGRLTFTTDMKSAVQRSLVIFIAVGTPPKEDGSADLQYVEKVAKDIARYQNGFKVVVNKSTVPVGAGQWIKDVIKKNQPEPKHFAVVSNPEFLREGSAIEDFMRPDRVVIGSDSEEAIAIMQDLYSPLYLIETPFVITNLETAELIKYASNAFLATKISFINEIANLCELVGADVHHVAKGMGLDNRIGRKFLHPGPGFGGSCFPKDTRALEKVAEKHGYELKIVKATIEVNEQQRRRMVEKIVKALENPKDKVVGLLGLSFKPNTNDIRESPAISIAKDLMARGAKIRAYDPAAMEEAKHELGEENITYCQDAYDAASGADILVLAVEWNQFRSLDMDRIKSVMKQPIMADLKNVYDRSKMEAKGFTYVAVGR